MCFILNKKCNVFVLLVYRCNVIVLLFYRCNDDSSSTYMQPSVDLLSPSQSSTLDFSSIVEQNEEQDLVESLVTVLEWRNVTGNLKNLVFTAPSGVSNYCIEQLDGYQPINFYNLFC